MAEQAIIDILDELAGEGELSPENKQQLDAYLKEHGASNLPDEYADIANQYLKNHKSFLEVPQQTGDTVTGQTDRAAQEIGLKTDTEYKDDMGNSATIVRNSFDTTHKVQCANGAALTAEQAAAVIDKLKASGDDASFFQGLKGEEVYEFPHGPNPIAQACDTQAAKDIER